MAFSDTTYNLRIKLDTHHCELSAETLARFEKALHPLRELCEKFPVSDLYITVSFQSRSQSHRVTTALVLSGRTLVAGDIDRYAYTAFERCVRKLVHKLEAYQQDLSATDELAKREKGTRHDVLPLHEPDADQLQQAVSHGDYAAFRAATAVYEEPIRMRIGRWVQRYPDIESRIDVDLKLDDVVEEVFLNAFERFEERPPNVPLGIWLEQLIDPSVTLLAEDPETELENIDFARTVQEMAAQESP